MKRRTATARFRELGDELRRIRAKANLTGIEVAHRTGWDSTRISRAESGHVKLSEVDLIHYLGACGMYLRDATEIMALCREAHQRSDYWLDQAFSGLVYHEGTCGSATTYEPQVIPGLLQTESYARVTINHFTGGQTVEHGARRRMDRQRILRRPIPPRCDFFIDENALRREVGGPEIMHEQLLTLALVRGLPSVTIRILPRSGGISTAFGGAFKVLRFADHQPMAYLDAHIGGLFLQDEKLVTSYRQLVPEVADAALNEHESRELLAELANDFDRANARQVTPRAPESVGVPE